jgi:Na+-transporting NADH:ubiquinone oxidoreductase subunit A
LELKIHTFAKNFREISYFSIMAGMIRIKKGLNIELTGMADAQIHTAPAIEHFAIKPTDFHGLIPKMLVKAGDKVQVGTPLFFDKYNPEIRFSAPVSGEVIDVLRGERRKVLEVIIRSDGQMDAVDFGKQSIQKLDAAGIKSIIREAGLWPFIKQRPYDIIARPDKEPKAIFISGFDSAPLAPNYNFIISRKEEAFKEGVKILRKLTQGKVYLNVDAGAASKTFKSVEGVEITEFSGPHPAGNVGVQIHKLDPINKGEVVWTINPQDVAAIGNLFLTGKHDSARTLVITGSEVIKTAYIETILGASVKELMGGNIKNDTTVRIISGNVLTGEKISSDGFVGAYHHQVTVIPEGDHYDFMGWANPGFNKFSAHRTIFSTFFSNKAWKLDANLNGGHRALVMSGEYEKVLPMDILPEFLVKAIIVKDIDKMEQLGIYEIAPEDMALCEVVCTSKLDVQQIIREGLDLVYAELG